jgi:heme exporter protein A
MELVAEGLRCVRGGREVFAGVGFRVSAGAALVVTGPNGAGKSSLLRLLAGLLRPAEGEARLLGGEGDLTLAEQAHFVGHLDPVKPSLAVAENLSFWTRFLGGGAGLPVAAALAALGLDSLADLPAAYLSAGQRRRLSLARLLALARPVWLLDEPTAALDAPAQARFAELMRAHLGGGGLIVAATHAPLGLGPAQELRLGPGTQP